MTVPLPLSNAPLSAAQRQLWAGQQIYPQSPLYNMALSFRITGPIAPERFGAAFDQLVAETDVLRLVVTLEAGEPVQSALPQSDGTLRLVDVSNDNDPHRTAHTWMQGDCREALDLSVCAWRSALIRLGADNWIWYFNHHHVHSDILSTQNLFRRLSEIYSASDSTPIGSTYGAFLAREAALASAPDNAAEDWFSKRADGTAPLLYGRDATTPDTGATRVTVPLSTEISTRITDLAARPAFRSLTPDMSHYAIFATALAAFLSRITGEERQSVGTPVHNRPRPEFRKSPGMFTSVLPMQLDIAADDSFTTLFAKVQAETMGLLRYSAQGSALRLHQRAFNTVFNFITAEFGAFAGMPCHPEWLHPGHGDPHHHMRFQVERFGGHAEFVLHFDLNDAMFDAGQRRQVVAHFLTLLDALLSQTETAIAALPMVSDEEKVRDNGVLTGLTPPEKPELITKAFAAQVRKTPDALALRCGDISWSYADLDARTSDLARHLASIGAGRGTRVAVLLSRSPSAVVAILATLKSGASFVPLDVKAPQSRLAFQLTDMKATAVISAAAFASRIPDGIAHVVLDDAGCADPGLPRVDEAPETPCGDDAAYVLYTSGSTGQPKGVQVSHASLAHYITWARSTYCGSRKLAFPLFTPLTFDLTMTSLFLPLITGGSVVIYPEGTDAIDTALLSVLRDDLVDIIKLTPSHMRLIEPQTLGETKLRQMIVGGEDFPTELARHIHDASGGKIAMHNEYGPTEATVGCFHHTFDPRRDLGASVPIGRPIENMQARILTPAGQPVPRGVPGELWVAGDGVALGYLNREEMTADRFCVPPGETERMYRTGDLVRMDDEGTVHYLGRIDQQMKLNGVRIEPGEVEAAVSTHPAVTGCVVVASQSKQGAHESAGFCPRCGLSTTYPDAEFDDNGVCSLCAGFEDYRDEARAYFDNLDSMLEQMSVRRSASAPYDCIALLSGGKDSTYMLGRLVELGLRVLAFTLDNGFISEEAKVNIARVVKALGVDHVYGSTPAMNDIFVDSLRRNSNVCHGCFKTIYTLSMQLARDRGIPYIVTGLSRGQFFETRLTPELFSAGGTGCAEIDDIVLRARKAYHRVEDAVAEHLDVADFQTDEIFEEVQFIDFYRYCDVSMEDLYAFLDDKLPWVRPSDTGRSTNCLINDVGIYVHKKERGYHNYALPYSWDVRLGHKERDAARDELEDDIDVAHVENILARIGYKPKDATTRQHILTAYYTADAPVAEEDLKDAASAVLPPMLVPGQFVHLAEFPLSANGKVDRGALAELRGDREEETTVYVAPENAAEHQMAQIWQDVLKLPRIGVHHNFHDLGGDSINAIQIVARANSEGLNLRAAELFDAPTVAQLAALAASRGAAATPDTPRKRRNVAPKDTSKLAGVLQALDRKGGG